jgi:hypothetical protein
MKTLEPHLTKTLESKPKDFVPVLSEAQQETLKWLAIFTMTLDHANKLLFNFDYPVMFWLGRLTFPLFAFLIAYNLAVREVKPTRYLWPLLLFALITQPLSMWVWQDTEGNILFTLYLGVLYVGLQALLSQRLHTFLAHALLVIIFFLPSLQVQYGPIGVFLIPLLAAFLKKPTLLAYTLLSVYLLAINALLQAKIMAFFVSPLHGFYQTFSGLEPYMLVPLLLFPVVLLISQLPLTLQRGSSWFFYGFYPLHMLALYLLAPLIP